MKFINKVIMMIAMLFTRTIVVKTKSELQAIIAERVEKYGPKCNLNDLRFPAVTDLTRLFVCRKFNGDISKWDVSNVRNMERMFCNSEFNGDISKWDVSNVKNMESMFKGSIFDGDISKWDVSNVTDMEAMFRNSKFNGDISKWDVRNVRNMNWMFCNSKFNGDISKWDVITNVTTNVRMFEGIQFTGKQPNWRC